MMRARLAMLLGLRCWACATSQPTESPTSLNNRQLVQSDTTGTAVPITVYDPTGRSPQEISRPPYPAHRASSIRP